MQFLDIFTWKERRRRRQHLEEGVSDSWREILRKCVRQYQGLPREQQRRLEGCTAILAEEKAWEACDDLELTDEIRVTIAGQASLLLLGLGDWYFDELHTIVVYPGALLVSNLEHYRPVFLGEADGDGRVVLAWNQVRREIEDQHASGSLVVHEFAHIIDMLTGVADGVPPIENGRSRQAWSDAMRATQLQLEGEVRRGENSVLRPRAATNTAELFSIASEAFFQSPEVLKEGLPAIWKLLASWYRVDPSSWVIARSTSRERSADVSEMPRDELEEELAEADRFVACHPDYLGSWQERGSAHQALGQYEAAISDYTKALEISPEDIDTLCSRAVVHALAGDAEASLADATRATELLPELADGWILRSRAHELMGDPRQALTAIQRAISQDADNTEALQYRGELLHAAGNYRAARRDLDRALRLDDTDAFAFHSRALLLADIGDLDGALDDTDRAIQLLPDWAMLYATRGQLRMEAGGVAGARADLDKALQEDPDLYVAWIDRGNLSYDEHDYAAAIADYEAAIRLSPENAVGHECRGAALQLSGRPAEALSSLDQAVGLDPDYASAHAFRALALTDLDRLDEALEAVRSALALDPQCSPAYHARGKIHEARGNLEAARRDREKAAEFKRPEDHW